MNQRLTRKEIKRDEFATAVGRGVEYAESHARTLTLAIGAAIAVALLAFLAYALLGSRSEKSSEALAHAMKVYNAPINATGAKPDDPKEPSFADQGARRARAKQLFEEVRDDYGSTDAADIAGLYLAQIALAEGQPDRARELWAEFVDDHGDHILASEARVNLIHLDRQQGKGEELAQRLKAMLEEEEPALPKDVILNELAVTLEQLNRKEEAVQAYQRILDEFPQSVYRATAQQKVTTLDPSRSLPGAAGPGGPPPIFPGGS